MLTSSAVRSAHGSIVTGFGRRVVEVIPLALVVEVEVVAPVGDEGLSAGLAVELLHPTTPQASATSTMALRIRVLRPTVMPAIFSRESNRLRASVGVLASQARGEDRLDALVDHPKVVGMHGVACDEPRSVVMPEERA